MFDPWVGKITWRRKWQPILIFLPEKSHEQRSLEGYSPWGCEELDTTEYACSLSIILMPKRHHLGRYSLVLFIIIIQLKFTNLDLKSNCKFKQELVFVKTFREVSFKPWRLKNWWEDELFQVNNFLKLIYFNWRLIKILYWFCHTLT